MQIRAQYTCVFVKERKEGVSKHLDLQFGQGCRSLDVCSKSIQMYLNLLALEINRKSCRVKLSHEITSNTSSASVRPVKIPQNTLLSTFSPS